MIKVTESRCMHDLDLDMCYPREASLMQEDLFSIPPFVVEVLKLAGVDLDEVLSRCDSSSAGQAGRSHIRLRTDRYFAFWRALEAAAFPLTSACG